jgi:hypothetical protein
MLAKRVSLSPSLTRMQKAQLLRISGKRRSDAGSRRKAAP